MSFIFYCYLFLQLFILISSSTFIFDETKKKQLEQLIEKQKKLAKMHTVGIIITNNETTLYQNIFSEDNKITNQTPFILGSISKSFTALSILKLKNFTTIVNQTLDNFDLGKYLSKELLKNITVGELLNHTSGLDAFSPKQPYKKGEFSYSNYGYSLLGKVIEKVSNMKYSKYVEENIFKPLGMNNTRAEYNEYITQSYDNFLGARSKFSGLKLKMNQKDGFFIPAGFISSSIEDMGKYLRFYLDKNNSDYVSKMTVCSVEEKPNIYYGMGIHVLNKSDNIIYHHNGGTSSFLSDFYIYPSLNVAFLVLTNTNDLLCMGPSYQFVTALQNFLIYNANNVYDGVDSSLFLYYHFTYDCLFLFIVSIPITYLVITIVRKIKRKKYTWFNDIKGIIIFAFDILVLFILPIVVLIYCFLINANYEFIITNVKDFFYTIITVCVALWLTFIIKIVYLILYQKFNWEKFENKDDKMESLVNMNADT